MNPARIFRWANIVGLCMSLCVPLARAAPTTRLELSNSGIRLGQAFDLSVYIDGVTDSRPGGGQDEILAFGFDVVAPTNISFTGAEVGPSFSETSSKFPNTDVSALASPKVGGEDILLATVGFTALEPGNIRMGIFSDLSDPNEGLFTRLYSPMDITTTMDLEISEVPLPAAHLLLGSAIAAVPLFRRASNKRRKR